MQPSIKADLEAITKAVERLSRKMLDLPLRDRIDIAARLNGTRKVIDTIDEYTKMDVKKRLKGIVGYVNGEIFKAYFNLFPVTRFDQGAFKQAEPTLFARYERTGTESRITYEPR
jgi:hypothetical protein